MELIVLSVLLLVAVLIISSISVVIMFFHFLRKEMNEGGKR